MRLRFEVPPRCVRFLRTPSHFFQVSSFLISRAQRRVVLAALYIGTGPRERFLVDLLSRRIREVASAEQRPPEKCPSNPFLWQEDAAGTRKRCEATLQEDLTNETARDIGGATLCRQAGAEAREAAADGGEEGAEKETAESACGRARSGVSSWHNRTGGGERGRRLQVDILIDHLRGTRKDGKSGDSSASILAPLLAVGEALESAVDAPQPNAFPASSRRFSRHTHSDDADASGAMTFHAAAAFTEGSAAGPSSHLAGASSLPSVGESAAASVRVSFLRNPLVSSTFLGRWLPPRLNEVVGVQHMKALVVDDAVLFTGANFSGEYLVNRADRYVVVNAAAVADAVHAIVQATQKGSFSLRRKRETQGSGTGGDPETRRGATAGSPDGEEPPAASRSAAGHEGEEYEVVWDAGFTETHNPVSDPETFSRDFQRVLRAACAGIRSDSAAAPPALPNFSPAPLASEAAPPTASACAVSGRQVPPRPGREPQARGLSREGERALEAGDSRLPQACDSVERAQGGQWTPLVPREELPEAVRGSGGETDVCTLELALQAGFTHPPVEDLARVLDEIVMEAGGNGASQTRSPTRQPARGESHAGAPIGCEEESFLSAGAESVVKADADASNGHTGDTESLYTTSSRGSSPSMVLASPYLNLPTRLLRSISALCRQRVNAADGQPESREAARDASKVLPSAFDQMLKTRKLIVITAAPQANSFFKSRGVSRYIPEAYAYLAYQVARALKRAAAAPTDTAFLAAKREPLRSATRGSGAEDAETQSACLKLGTREFTDASREGLSDARRPGSDSVVFEYCRPGWTFHTKGMWLLANADDRGNGKDSGCRPADEGAQAGLDVTSRHRRSSAQRRPEERSSLQADGDTAHQRTAFHGSEGVCIEVQKEERRMACTEDAKKSGAHRPCWEVSIDPLRPADSQAAGSKAKELPASLPYVTVFGSSNFSERAERRDLELSCVLRTTDRTLQLQMKGEIEDALRHSKPVEAESLKTRYGWVTFFAVQWRAIRSLL
ncbi:hypothetical protein BESB_006420 [Besnoitia besnoiti]|uniref:CDP-diacylglycerol--glycerol-3-phosphate 1-phosphatidyltransferase n=1 Tax=Besnoitia besnoiti TaxID=94643 RepID=A0A2A9MNW6_BESBE|nr:hypothetical protein BESB_006420 [Besnoitia besnoiti]PFH38301.1 hypothetical protein BESB_006420 [Besnoitia besnoiti]